MTLLPCDPEIFAKGQPLFVANAFGCGTFPFDAWVRRLADASGQRIDWHQSGGLASVLFLGERAAIRRAASTIEPCPAPILRWFEDGEPGLYRGGVTPMPDGAISAWYEGGGGSTFA